MPTFGLPTSATRRGPAVAVPASRGASGSAAMIESSRSPELRPCSALTGCGSPRPSDHSDAVSASSRSSSTLFAASRTGFFERRSTRATASSVVVAPTVASTTSSTASAVRMAISACAATEACKPVASGSQPPVSTSVNRRPAQKAS
ncbi:hypothetical protein A4R44_06678 [Amycolatopsis sp. M39]|nr:hypothetical protein A4R44_06678 [Amycolatopsis sp. M39]